MYNETIQNKDGKVYQVKFYQSVGPIDLYITETGVIVDNYGIEISAKGVEKLKKLEKVMEKRRLFWME